MKKTVIMGIALLFLVAGLELAVAQPSNVGGKLSIFTPKVTYQQRLVPKDTAHTDGAKFVTVNVPIKAGSAFDPVLYIEVDPVTGNPVELNFFWKNAADSDDHILALFCPLPAMIIQEPIVVRPPDEDSISAAAVNRPEIGTDTIQGTAVCFFCPNGILIDADGEPIGEASGDITCNDGQLSNAGQPTAMASLNFKATLREKIKDETPINIKISGTITGGQFDYRGQTDWASANCVPFPDLGATCPALFNATFSATLLPCNNPSFPQCENLYLPTQP